VIAAATAEAFRPGATVDSVVAASTAYVSLHTRQIIDQTMQIAAKYPDIREIREPIRKHFMPTYPYADAVETAAEAIALFWITKGDVREGLVGATNLGRDTDCIGGMLGSVCGAFKGIDGVPAEWVDTVQKAIDANTVTMQKMSMRETAVGLTDALLKNLAAIRQQAQELGELCGARSATEQTARQPALAND
jgi:ADP-ribosylglycohydrolase